MRAIRDLTKRKQVHEAQLQLAAIVESSDGAITGESLEGLITSWNRGAERIYGYIAEEVLGKPIVLLVPPEREDEVPALLEKVRRGERVEHYETVRMRKDGRRIHISLTLSPIKDKADLITGASAVARDITEHKRTQEQVHLFNRELETLIHVISHDLKEPLRAIESFSVMVRDQYAARLDEKGQDLLQRVIRAAARLRLLLDDILMHSHARRIAPPTDEIEGKVVLQEALGHLQLMIEKTGAKITVAEDLPRVRGDKLWMTQAS